jgi:hypothetical protein
MKTAIEYLAMIAAAGDHLAERSEERRSRHAEPVGPHAPRPGLVDDRLADVEDDRPDVVDQWLFSCQLVPPSGLPGRGT